MPQAEELRTEHVRDAFSRRPPVLAALVLSLVAGLAACDDNRDRSSSRSQGQETRQAQQTPPETRPTPAPPRSPDAARPPGSSPGAAPSRARIVGTWTVTEAKAGSATAKGVGDKSEGTTYRFEDGGKVTVAGAKQCSYAMQPDELKVDCAGTVTAGKIEFRDQDQTLVWSIGADESLTLKKR
jgi:hypothetical protein